MGYEISARLPAGEYWIGDPCYVLTKANGFNWDRILTQTNCLRGGTMGSKGDGGLFHYIDPESHSDVTFFVSSTEYGDGCFRDGEDNEYGVDAGCLACIPLKAITGTEAEGGNLLYAGHVHNMESSFYCETKDEDGEIRFGHVRIATG